VVGFEAKIFDAHTCILRQGLKGSECDSGDEAACLGSLPAGYLMLN